MKIKWYGQASFLITADDGTMIVTDPYTPETSGYQPVREAADIALISSDNDSFHCRADLIPGQPVVVNALALAQNGGERVEKGIPIRAIEAMEALNHAYHDPDQNGMYRFVVDGISFGHMGDVGNALSEEQMAFFKGVDVLLALAGGHPTIELDDLMTVIERAQPRLIIPMHFRTLTYKPRNSLWIETFLSRFPNDEIDFAFSSEATLTRDTLPSSRRLLVLDYVHGC